MNDITDNWASFGNDYLKAIEVQDSKDEYAIVGVDSKEENGKNTLILKIQRNEVEKIFGCNKTNLYAVQQECPNGPKEAIGRIVTFNKVQVTNPQTKQTVDGLRIKFKPKKAEEDLNENSGINPDGTI